MRTKEQREFLQFIAMVTMVIDHIGAIFFPEQAVFRVIGRCSFPLFAYGIAEGVEHTHDFGRYFLRILLFALISQPFYRAAFGLAQGNPLFMLAWGGLALWLWKKETAGGRILSAVLLIASFGADMSYGWYGVWMIFLFGLFRKEGGKCFPAMALLTALYGVFTHVWIQMYCLLSFLFLESGKAVRQTHLPRYFVYGFYPVHLGVLLLVQKLMTV